MNTYHYQLPPVVDLPNNPVVSPPYVPPPAVSVKSEVDITFTVPDVPSVEFVVEAPTSRPLSSYDYNPIRSDYNPLTVSVPAGVNGQYVPAKTVMVQPLLNLGGNIATVENQTYPTAVPQSQDNIVGLQPNITYAGNAPIFGLAGNDAEFWSEFPAIQNVSMGGFGMTGLGNVTMADGGKINNLSELTLADGDIRGCSYLQIDGQILTADSQDLLLNGQPIATINNLPSLDQWAEYPAIQNVVMNAEGVSGQPYGVTGSKFYGFSNNSTLGVTGSGATSVLLFDGNAIGGTGTGPSQWANYPAISDISGNGKNLNAINNITFNNAIPVPIIGNATINNINSLNFAPVTTLLGQGTINNVNTVAFYNPTYPNIPGFNVNLYSKSLTYGGLATTYLASDTKLSVPSLYTSVAPGLAGGKLEILGENADTATINGQPCSGSWANYPAVRDVEMNYHGLNNVYQIIMKHGAGLPTNVLGINANGDLTTNGNALVATNQWATFDAVQDINAAQHNLVNVPTITFANPANSLTTNGANQLVYNGQVVQSGAGNAVNWAQYPANANVVIPSAYGFSINATNTLTNYNSCVLNANVYHGVQGNNSSPDFVSYPTTFQVGGTTSPARTITMTAGAGGFGINSLTGINIDCTTLLSLATTGDLNVAGSLTTFELGEWNVACANWNVEAGALEWVTGGVGWGCGAFDLTATGTVLINAPLVNLAGASVSFTGGLVTIASGGLAVAAGGVSVTGGGVAITGGGLLVGGGVANLNGGASVTGTLTAPTISGVSTLAGTGGGAALTNIATINGQPVGTVGTGQQTYNISSPVFAPTITKTSSVIWESAGLTWKFTDTPTFNVTVVGFDTADLTNFATTGFYLTIQQGVTDYTFTGISLGNQVVTTPTIYHSSLTPVKKFVNASWNATFSQNFSVGTVYKIRLWSSVNNEVAVSSASYENMRVLISATASPSL